MTGNDAASRWEPKRIAVIGAGAMGTSLAAIVGQRVPVVIVCRNAARASRLFDVGARTVGKVEAASRPIVVRSVADLEAIGGVSAVFVATKTTAIPDVAADLRPLLGRIGDQSGAPYVVSYQNGIESGRHLMQMLKDRRVLRMVLNFGAVMRESTGDVEVTMNAAPHAIGCIDAANVRACERIAAALSEAGFETKYMPDIETEVWRKGLLNASMSPVAALVNGTVGEVLDSPSRLLVDRLLREGLAVAMEEGLSLDGSYVEWAFGALEAARSHTPSMVEDIRAGRESEVGQLNRQIIEHARSLGMTAPTHEVVDALIETFDWRLYHGRAASDGTSSG